MYIMAVTSAARKFMHLLAQKLAQEIEFSAEQMIR